MRGEITSYRLLRGVSALVGLGEGQREPYSLWIGEVVGVVFEPPHDDEGGPGNIFWKCSCFKFSRVVTALVSRCGDEQSCTCFQNEQSPRSLLVVSKISEIFRLVDKCSDRQSLCQIFMVSVCYIRSSLFPPDFHKVKDLFWSLLSYRCGDMVVSRFFYKFALILPMYFSN